MKFRNAKLNAKFISRLLDNALAHLPAAQVPKAGIQANVSGTKSLVARCRKNKLLCAMQNHDQALCLVGNDAPTDLVRHYRVLDWMKERDQNKGRVGYYTIPTNPKFIGKHSPFLSDKVIKP